MSSTLLSNRQRETAIERWDHPSEQYEVRVQNTLTQLKESVLNLSPIKQASSLGPEDIVITHLLETLGVEVPVFVLETGALNHETLALLERLQAHTKLPFEIYRPQPEEVIKFIKTKGQKAIYNSIDDRKACCHIRKLEPLSRALKGQRAWITGLRREQSSARAQVSFIDDSELSTKGYSKVNPLLDWTWGDVWHYIHLNQLDYNPLHDDFFPSIGCAPCTRAISMGEEFRAGRWWWEDESAKECGLHVSQGAKT